MLTIIESGNAQNSSLNLDLQSKKGDNLKISTLLYQFPLKQGLEITIGPKMFGYNGLAGKSTVYKERIAILDGSNFTTSSGIGPGVSISKENDNGLNFSLKFASNNMEMNDKSQHLISQIGLTKKKYGGTITANFNENFEALGIALFYKPKIYPSISASIEQKEGENIMRTINWIIGTQQEINSVTYGLAVGTYNDNEEIVYEGWSEIDIVDKIKLIPVLFMRENNDKNEFGFAINTKFSY